MNCLVSMTAVTLLAFAALATTPGSSTNELESGPPNIIFVLIDDMGYGDLGCYGGDPVLTPHTDRLAAEGTRFERFYVNSPICSPSRAAFLTGQYPERSGIRSFLNSRESNAKRGIPDWLDLQSPSIARVFDEHGYHTAHVGKWHLGGQREISDAPLITEYGFDTSLTNFEGLGDRILPEFGPKPNGEPFNHWPTSTNAKAGVGEITFVDRSRVTEKFVDRAIAEIDTATEAGNPFYLQLWLDDMHTPIQPLDHLRGNGSKTDRYAGVLQEMDRQLGRVFDHVRRNPTLAGNTLIVLTSDNGHEPGYGTGGPLRGSKTQLYEGGIRMPLIAWWPGVVPAGRVDDSSFVVAIDLAPTLGTLADLSHDEPFEGRDFSPALRGEPYTRALPVYWARPVDRPGRDGENLPELAIIDMPWKVLLDDDAEPRLFNVAQDPGETTNLADQRARRTREMSRDVATWYRRVAADLPVPLPSVEERRSAIASHDRAIRVLDGWIRDPFVVLDNDGYYYLTGTTPLPGDPREDADPYNTGLFQGSLVGWKMQVWRSRNLAEWEYLGAPYDLYDGVWDDDKPDAFDRVPEQQWRLWAPELHRIDDGRWAIVHTSPSPVGGANLSLTQGAELKGPFSNPMGSSIGRRHDPSLFRDDDGTWWMIWGATKIAPLTDDFSAFAAEPTTIGPAGEFSKMGHEGCLIYKIGEKYVLFGTGWSTGGMRTGSYNLYYAIADEITGPYSERRFAGRFLGHGTPFQDKQGRWWCTAFFNANQAPLDRDGIRDRDLSETASTINEQGVTLVPLDISIDASREPVVTAKDLDYARPGPDELQPFDFD